MTTESGAAIESCSKVSDTFGRQIGLAANLIAHCKHLNPRQVII